MSTFCQLGGVGCHNFRYPTLCLFILSFSWEYSRAFKSYWFHGQNHMRKAIFVDFWLWTCSTVLIENKTFHLTLYAYLISSKVFRKEVGSRWNRLQRLRWLLLKIISAEQCRVTQPLKSKWHIYKQSKKRLGSHFL